MKSVHPVPILWLVHVCAPRAKQVITVPSLTLLLKLLARLATILKKEVTYVSHVLLVIFVRFRVEVPWNARMDILLPVVLSIVQNVPPVLHVPTKRWTR